MTKQKVPNPRQDAENAAYQRRLTQLEEDTMQRRGTVRLNKLSIHPILLHEDNQSSTNGYRINSRTNGSSRSSFTIPTCIPFILTLSLKSIHFSFLDVRRMYG